MRKILLAIAIVISIIVVAYYLLDIAYNQTKVGVEYYPSETEVEGGEEQLLVPEGTSVEIKIDPIYSSSFMEGLSSSVVGYFTKDLFSTDGNVLVPESDSKCEAKKDKYGPGVNPRICVSKIEGTLFPFLAPTEKRHSGVIYWHTIKKAVDYDKEKDMVTYLEFDMPFSRRDLPGVIDPDPIMSIEPLMITVLPLIRNPDDIYKVRILKDLVFLGSPVQ